MTNEAAYARVRSEMGLDSKNPFTAGSKGGTVSGEAQMVAHLEASKTSYGKSSEKLGWDAVVSKKTGETRVEHVKLHESNDLTKQSHGVFYGNSQNTINSAWQNKSKGIKISEGNTDMYIIPHENAGYAGGFGGQRNNLNTVTIITQKGTNNIITGFPGNGYRYTVDGIIGGN